MSSQPPSDLNVPVDIKPTVIEAGHLDRIQRVAADPAGVPVHRTTIDAERRPEVFTAATSLDPAFSWFYLGFAYVFIRIELSLLEMYQASGNRTIRVLSHRAENPVVGFSTPAFCQNPWAYVLQGIPHEHADSFCGYAASYHFKCSAPAPKSFSLDFIEARAPDPFRQEKAAVPIRYALPRNLLNGRQVAMIQEPGLLLDRPMFAMVQNV